MSHHDQKKIHFQKCLDQLKRNYKYCAKGAFIIITSVISACKNTDEEAAPLADAVACTSGFTLPLSGVTIPAGLVGAVGNTIWGMFALPTAKIRDWRDSKKTNVDQYHSDIKSDNKITQISNSTTTQLMNQLGVINKPGVINNNHGLSMKATDKIVEKDHKINAKDLVSNNIEHCQHFTRFVY